ncbi:Putative zinc-finger [Sinosporangium album]|uniref:Putative zinc-finger n=1 Tax=Sinosporangium album TaxID=504805 RepID=A0A1G7R1B5_9ACTN|nr:zf-HC2 domain-containing protein [Sinosporangium album]SDG04556.1 Putative zinc-finger [Sinosporangium album]
MKRFSCDEAVELTTAYLENALGPTARSRFESHLAACEGCERHLRQIKTTIGLLGGLTVEQSGQAGQSEQAEQHGPLGPHGAFPPDGDRLPTDMRARLLKAFRERRTSAEPRTPL